MINNIQDIILNNGSTIDLRDPINSNKLNLYRNRNNFFR